MLVTNSSSPLFPPSFNSIYLCFRQFNHFEFSRIPNSYKNGRESLRITAYIHRISVSDYIQKNKSSGMVGGMVRVAAICGSLRKGSYNRGLIRSAIELSKGAVEGVEIEEVDIASLPMLNTDLEKQGTFPAEVEAFRRKILEADSILFASPEYNFSVTAPLKNAMDWGSRPPNVWGGKTAGIVSAGGLLGGATGQFHLRQIGIYIDLHFLNKPEFFIKAFEPPPKFNPLNGDLIDEDAKLRLKQMLLSLKAFTLQLHHNN